jgi:phosphatidylglycerophosphatase A
VNIRVLLLTGFGLGRIGVAPGTVASLATTIAALAVLRVGGEVWLVNVCLLALAAGFSMVCLWFGLAGELHFRRKDASPIVADEIAGQSLALLFLPWRDDDWGWNLAIAATGFAAFRAFDILKPPPIRKVQWIGGGLGILADDLIAAAYAAVVAQIAARVILPGWIG